MILTNLQGKGGGPTELDCPASLGAATSFPVLSLFDVTAPRSKYGHRPRHDPSGLCLSL